MYLEQFKGTEKDKRKDYLNSLDDSAKASLYSEIKADRQKAQEEKIKAQAQLDSVNESLNELLTSINNEGIEVDSIDKAGAALDLAIDELNQLIDTALLEYVEKIGE